MSSSHALSHSLVIEGVAALAKPVLCVVGVNWMVCFEDWALVYTFTGLNKRPYFRIFFLFVVAFFTVLCNTIVATIFSRVTAELALKIAHFSPVGLTTQTSTFRTNQILLLYLALARITRFEAT